MADFLIGIFVMPLALYQDFYQWPDEISCPVWIAIDVTCSTASCLSVMLISLDRCFICIRPISPHWYREQTAVAFIFGRYASEYNSSDEDIL